MSNNIRDFRSAKGWSQRELAERMSKPDDQVHFTTVAKIEKSQRKLTLEWAERFAAALGVEVPELYSHEIFLNAAGPRQIPVIGMVSAGAWREAIQSADEHIVAPAEGANVFSLKVDGHSMDRVAPAGAYVLVDPDQFDLLDGAYYVIMNDGGDATFKQYRANPARLEPLSSDTQYQPITLGREPFSVVGKVVGMYQKFA